MVNFNFKTVENTPLSDPSIELQNSLKKSYMCMNEIRNRNKTDIEKKRRRRCNRCGKYFATEETFSVKYKPDSNRRHRLCSDCNNIIKGEVKE